MSKRSRITEDDCRLALALYKRGASAYKIADAINLSYCTVRKVIQFSTLFKEIGK